MFRVTFIDWLRRHGYTQVQPEVWEKEGVRYTLRPASFLKQYQENGRWLNDGTCRYSNTRLTQEDKLLRTLVTR